jgi:DNA-binding FadR family transcriptional regulator
VENEEKIFKVIFKGNQAAVELAGYFGEVYQIWDDLVDQDRAVTAEEINRAFFLSLVEIPQNSFYREHSHYLLPIVNNSIHGWLDANQFETSKGTHERAVAYVLRDKVNDLMIMMAYLIGGYDWSKKASILIRKKVYDEPFEDYCKSLDEGQ